MDFVGKRKIWYILSLVVIIPGLISLALQGLNLGIDFAGGNTVQIKFANPVVISDLRENLAQVDLGSGKIQEMEDGSFQIKTAYMEPAEQDAKIAQLKNITGDFTVLRNDVVGPTVGRELLKTSILALVVAVGLMIAYISFRFEWRFALSGIIALMHDILFTVCLFSIFQWEVDSTFIAALLTIFGYSINDTIVIFDRIRENIGNIKKDDLHDVVNMSIHKSLTRSINTTVGTLIILVCLFLFGGETTKLFVLAMILGIASGAYSSIFVASPLWYDMTMRSKVKRV